MISGSDTRLALGPGPDAYITAIVPLSHLVQILLSYVLPVSGEMSATEQNVVILVRLPRILLGLLVGGGLAIAGTALQATFRNP